MKDREKRLYDALTDIDDAYIVEAHEAMHHKQCVVSSGNRRPKWLPWLVTAAAIALVVFAAYRFGWIGGTGTNRILAASVVQAADVPSDSTGSAWLNSSASNRFTEAMTMFAMESTVKLAAEEDGNLTYSPVSLYYALAMLAEGSGGGTEAALLDVLGMPNRETLAEDAGNYLRAVSYSINTSSIASKLQMANSVWFDNEVQDQAITFKQEYLDTLSSEYHASTHQVDFADPDAAKAIGSWIKENTAMDVIDPLETDENTLMTLINAIDFQAEWVDQFRPEDVEDGEFRTGNNQSVTVSFMHRVETGGFARNDTFTRASLPLKSQATISFILPDEDTSVDDLLVDEHVLHHAIYGGTDTYGEVTWQIPKFRTESNLVLDDLISQMGLSTVFSPNADLSRITASPLWLSSAKQETVFEINEEGVSASAYSTLQIAGEPIIEDRAEMILDRPFLYVVSVREVPLFVGVCRDPSVG